MIIFFAGTTEYFNIFPNLTINGVPYSQPASRSYPLFKPAPQFKGLFDLLDKVENNIKNIKTMCQALADEDYAKCLQQEEDDREYALRTQIRELGYR